MRLYGLQWHCAVLCSPLPPSKPWCTVLYSTVLTLSTTKTLRYCTTQYCAQLLHLHPDPEVLYGTVLCSPYPPQRPWGTVLYSNVLILILTETDDTDKISYTIIYNTSLKTVDMEGHFTLLADESTLGILPFSLSTGFSVPSLRLPHLIRFICLCQYQHITVQYSTSWSLRWIMWAQYCTIQYLRVWMEVEKLSTVLCSTVPQGFWCG